MAFVNIDTKLKLILTSYGKEKLIKEGDLNIKFFNFSDSGVNYELTETPTKVTDVDGNANTTLYNGMDKNSIRYKK
jgi:hypothetical protein